MSMKTFYTKAELSIDIDADELVDDARHIIEEIAHEAAENAIGDSVLEDVEERVEALEAKLAEGKKPEGAGEKPEGAGDLRDRVLDLAQAQGRLERKLTQAFSRIAARESVLARACEAFEVANSIQAALRAGKEEGRD